MKNNLTLSPVRPAPNDEDVRDYACHVYEQSRCVAGHDFANWLEAIAGFKANIPAHRSHNRLHWPVTAVELGDVCASSAGSRNLAS